MLPSKQIQGSRGAHSQLPLQQGCGEFACEYNISMELLETYKLLQQLMQIGTTAYHSVNQTARRQHHGRW